jgi:hypothetical protein
MKSNCLDNGLMTRARFILAILIFLIIKSSVIADPGNADWMIKAKWGIFMHYQYRILLGYSSGH